MKKILLLQTIMFTMLSSCIVSNTKYFAKAQSSTDNTYGYSASNPVLIKNADLDHSIGSSYYYIAHLRSAKGNKLTLLSRRSVFNPKYQQPDIQLVNRYSGMPLNGKGQILDLYVLKAENEADTIKIHINPYEKGKVMIPVGLTFENE
jgi:hypothetical protein